jgi:hypothetical protein
MSVPYRSSYHTLKWGRNTFLKKHSSLFQQD